jgi:hypothetical protein
MTKINRNAAIFPLLLLWPMMERLLSVNEDAQFESNLPV